MVGGDDDPVVMVVVKTSLHECYGDTGQHWW